MVLFYVPQPTVTKLSCIHAHRVFCLCFAWCPCIAINVICNLTEGFSPILSCWPKCCYHQGTRLNAMKSFLLSLQPMFPPTKRFDIFSPCLGMLIMFGFVQTFLYTRIQIATKSLPGKTNREHEEILHKPFGWKAFTWLYLLEFSSRMLTVPSKSLLIFILASAAEIVRT